MAKCKLCKKPINDETEYCADCADKKDLLADESYLDDLLNSVQNKVTSAGDIYKKKRVDHKVDSPDIEVPSDNDTLYSIYSNDLDEFEQYDLMKEFDEPIAISKEDIYGDAETRQEADNDEEQEEDIINSVTVNTEDEDEKDEKDIEHNIDNEFLEMDWSDEQSILDDESIEPVLDDLLKNLNLADDNDEIDEPFLNEDRNGQDNTGATENMFAAEDVLASVGELVLEDIPTAENEFATETDFSSNSESIAPENELLDLLNQFNPDNQGEDDIQAISDLLGGISESNQQMKDHPEDVGEVFSEALEAVSDLSDIDEGIQFKQEPILDDIGDTKEKKEKKSGVFAKLFANIDDEDLSPDKKESLDKAVATKKEKKKRKKRNKQEQVAEVEDGDEVSTGGRKEAGSSQEKKKPKREKKPKKEKKKKIEILDDDIYEGHINKAGASIVFLFFGLLVILLLISTNIFSYSFSIKNARDYFGRQRYTQAYNEVYGIELKDEDIELYDKIMTVMYVNKQLNSYNNYYHMRKFPEALDSLLKGLQRYDKYIELATMLGINTDLDYVRNQIVAELYNVFSLTEEQAMNIINSESQAKYSISVYDVILENISFYN